jgi:ubiquitin carboxyl-terminal hydrolase 22/27/51
MKAQPPPPAGSANAVNAHCVYADVERAELFCAACGTHVYALEFDKTVNGVAAVATGVGATTSGVEKRGGVDGDAIAGEEGGVKKRKKTAASRTASPEG